MSEVREAVRARGRGRKAPKPAPVGRFGSVDLALTALVLVAMWTRTPMGSLLGYAVDRLQGDSPDLPTLTAWFSSGAAAPPSAALEALPPPVAAAPDGLPEPWRTAAHSVLARRLPGPLATRLRSSGGTADEAAALEWIDHRYRAHQDPARALEEAALGEEAVERAVGRARAAGEADPWTYDAHRRFLSSQAAEEADRFVGGTLALATALDLAWPLRAPHRVTSPYGERFHPVLRTRRFHDGVDLAVPTGTEVHAAQAGTLEVVGQGKASGKYVVVDHGHGVRTSYCHLSETPLPRGTRVGRGEVLALSGNTGRSTGPHLHYAVRIAGRTVDPERFRRREDEGEGGPR